MLQQSLPFTVLKPRRPSPSRALLFNSLQQSLPFTVLKLNKASDASLRRTALQQSLPFTVLKLSQIAVVRLAPGRCNSPYRLRY